MARKNDVWHALMREAAKAERENVDCFECREPEPGPASTDLDYSQLEGFEQVVNEWLDRQHGQENKTKAVTFFVGMISRLRNKLGLLDREQTRLQALDDIGMSIVSDFTVTIDGHSSIGIERLAPRLSRVCFEGQESVRIVGTEELEPAKCDLKCNVKGGEIACRELVFRDDVTGRTEVRRYALIDGKVGRVYSGRATTNWITRKENYLLTLIRSVLSEVSK